MPRGKRITSEDKAKILETIKEVGYQQIGACRAVDFATKSGFSYDAVRKMREKSSEFRNAVIDAQEIFRESLQGSCENALIKRALGYEAIEQFHEVTKDGTGNIVSKKINERKKHVAPDIRALEFVLINVSRGTWRDVRDVEVSTNFGDRKDLTPEEVKSVREKIDRMCKLGCRYNEEVDIHE